MPRRHGRRAGIAGLGRELLRVNGRWWGLWLWHSFQVDESRHPDHIAQLRRNGRELSEALGPGNQRQPLWDHVQRWQPQRVFRHWLRNRLQNDARWSPDHTLRL